MSEQYPPQYPGPYNYSPQHSTPEQPTYQSPYPSQSMYPPPPPPPSQPMYPPQQLGYAPYPQYGMAPTYGTSRLSVASLILGIVGLCTGIAGIAAVICGHMALNQIKRSGEMIQGRGLAIAGLVLGYLEIAGMVAWVLLVVLSIAFSAPVNQ